MRLLIRPDSSLHKASHNQEAGSAAHSSAVALSEPDEHTNTAADIADISPFLGYGPSDQISTHFLQRAKGFLKAEVYLTQFNGQSVVCKDYRRYAGTPAALVARWLVRHELKMLEQLGGWIHAPKAIARLSPLALAMEYIPGPLLSDAAPTSDITLCQQLIRIVQQLHHQQMAHNDIRGSNVVLRDGIPVLIDFTSAVRLPRWPGTAILARTMRRFDLRHSLKLKQRTLGLPLSTREASLVMRGGRLNSALRLWKKQILPRLKGR